MPSGSSAYWTRQMITKARAIREASTDAVIEAQELKLPVKMDVFKTLLLDTPDSLNAITGTLQIANGGTGATSAAGARDNLLPDYTGNVGKVLTVNAGATDVEWTTNGAGTVTSVDVSGGTTGLTTSGGPVTSSGTITLAGTLAVANGGTGITSLGSGVATFLGTPSSANLAAAVTDETGTGALVFANSPTLVTPALGTPASGVVTNLTGTASININGTVGATTASTGAFTTLSASGAITPSQTAGIVGTTTNNNADAGAVGEYVESTIASASKISLTNITGANVTSISLTAGDWDVWGNAYFDPAASTTFDLIISSISTVSATSPSRDTGNQSVLKVLDFGTGIPSSVQPVPQRLSLSATTTVYLVVVCSFAVSTMHAFGTLRARRVR
jgi:hypothetical protein